MLADAQRSPYAEQGFFIADDAVVVAEDGVKVG